MGERALEQVGLDGKGHVIPTPEAVAAIERTHPLESPMEKKRLAAAQTLIDAYQREEPKGSP